MNEYSLAWGCEFGKIRTHIYIWVIWTGRQEVLFLIFLFLFIGNDKMNVAAPTVVIVSSILLSIKIGITTVNSEFIVFKLEMDAEPVDRNDLFVFVFDF